MVEAPEEGPGTVAPSIKSCLLWLDSASVDFWGMSLGSIWTPYLGLCLTQRKEGLRLRSFGWGRDTRDIVNRGQDWTGSLRPGSCVLSCVS